MKQQYTISSKLTVEKIIFALSMFDAFTDEFWEYAMEFAKDKNLLETHNAEIEHSIDYGKFSSCCFFYEMSNLGRSIRAHRTDNKTVTSVTMRRESDNKELFVL